ncbi:MAG: pentapeptide repeat-containing protein, partial [Pseudomonadota bacterium]
ANLDGARLQGANLAGAQLQGANLAGAQLQGARLFMAQLQGANLAGAQLDPATDLRAATLRGAALRSVDFTNVTLSDDQINQVFGDGSVVLPGGVTPDDREHWPAHFATEELEPPEFFKQWRAFQASIGFDPEDLAT